MLRLDWHDVERMVGVLEKRVRTMFDAPPYRIAGISRGGLIPATMLAHRLGAREVTAIGARSYEGQDQGPLKLYGLEGALGADLIVDELVETGSTVAAVRLHEPVAPILALIDKGAASDHGVITACSVPAEQWVAFPWERD